MKSSPLKSRGIRRLGQGVCETIADIAVRRTCDARLLLSNRLNPDARFFEQFIKAPPRDRIPASVYHECGFDKVGTGMLGCWRADYNNTRLRSQLGLKTPCEFAITCQPRRDPALRYAEGSATARRYNRPIPIVPKPPPLYSIRLL
ncbi:hypothetical protein [Bradyrhizobium mercantei]|uniref:hypothetical protein n=1 Tax=Bradyrhizobium mercantei TaxID=1904807 RepID=UPI00135645B5